MPGHWVVLRCRTGAAEWRSRWPSTTVTGFLSWLEAGPPRDPGSLPGNSMFGPRPTRGLTVPPLADRSHSARADRSRSAAGLPPRPGRVGRRPLRLLPARAAAVWDRPSSGPPASVASTACGFESSTPSPSARSPATRPECSSWTALPADEWIQQVAAEVNHAETAFPHRLPAGGAPTGAALVHARRRGRPLRARHARHRARAATRAAGGPVRFATRSGVLTATAGREGSSRWTSRPPRSPRSRAAPALARRSAPSRSPCSTPAPTRRRARRGGRREDGARADSGLRPAARDTGRGVIVTAAAEDPGGGTTSSPASSARRVGVDEDPVTGGAHAALTPFWAERLGRDELTGYQASAAGRPGPGRRCAATGPTWAVTPSPPSTANC